jgi:excisionase family DNA binding protein
MTDAEILLSEVRQLRDEVRCLASLVIFTTPEAAAYMKCDAGWLRGMADYGAIPCFRVGRDRRFRKVDLDAFCSSAIGAKALSKLASMRLTRESKG